MNSQRFGRHTVYLQELADKFRDKGKEPLPVLSATFDVRDPARHKRIVESFQQRLMDWWEQELRQSEH